MKRKMVEVNKCLECPYQGGVDECAAPKPEERFKFKIDDLDTIPDWCPLPDKEEIMNPDLDQVKCEVCGSNVYKEDCARTTDGGWICKECQDKFDSRDERGGEDGED